MDRRRWQVEVDRDACIGSGMCVGTAPDAFDLVEGRSQPLAERIEPDEQVLAAAESCPVEAIRVTDVDTGRQLAPPAD
ncbi:hypothetical protein GCM10012275_25530 [Longimycelium tulufanense]|uniref:Ferredoxin n=1 Tax=Longimycelium tulufanense TaxID=907463 RepID=A0A8J3CEE2_9PSEU|nr:ferredoxin [Longimycelium tulufanense]GGM53411.1 hypothetical protein GCM10012275_25530 [Longimycelium tulufanense]